MNPFPAQPRSQGLLLVQNRHFERGEGPGDEVVPCVLDTQTLPPDHGSVDLSVKQETKGKPSLTEEEYPLG